jgi:serine/threonine protein kinase
MISFVCSQCGRRLRAPDEQAGKKMKCPQCGGVTEVPRLVAAAPDGGAAPTGQPAANPGPTLSPISPPILVEPLDATEPPSTSTQATATPNDATLPPPAVVEVWPVASVLPLVGVPGYEILEELGRGGMGVVYKARQLRPRRLVALKMILAGEHAGAEALVRFRREAESVARLQHPNIVQVHEVGEHNGLPYLTLEYVEGGSLAHRLSRKRPTVRQSAALIEQLARAVHYAHQKGIVHRDLKPGNILLAADQAGGGTSESGWAPKIVDFGLAKQMEGMASIITTGPRTQTGAILGTPSYMAPEQAGGKSKNIGPAVDVYSLGAILYECLTGEPPFHGETTLDTLMQLATQEPIPPRQLRPKCPRDLEAVTLKCLQKDPARRYESALALADDLSRFLEGERVEARPPNWLSSLKDWTLEHKRAALIGGGVFLMLLVVLLIVLLRPSSEDEPDGRGSSADNDRPSIREAANRMSSQNNLREFGIAMHNVASAQLTMPPAAITDPQSGKPLLSWRVAILPYIEQDPLYKQFHLNEAWDSPHNIELLSQMPKVYTIPGTKAKEGYTFYQVFVGPGTPFDTRFASRGGAFGIKGPRMPASFPDGTSLTILIAEAAEAVPWTKPEDLAYDPKWPLPKLGGAFRHGFNVVMADGAVVFVSNNVSEQTLRNAITANDGNVLGDDWPDGNGKESRRSPVKKKAPEGGATVVGTVKYNGQPLSSGIVTFHGDPRTTAATIQADGTYLVEGLVPGNYKVTVREDRPEVPGPPGKKDKAGGPGGGPPGEAPPKRVLLPAKYGEAATTPLSVQVQPGKNTFDLELAN